MEEYASKGVANSALGLAIGGLATALLGGGGNVLGNIGAAGDPAKSYVSRGEMELEQKLAEKEAHIKLLEADKYTDQKIVELYNAVDGKIERIRGEMAAAKDAQAAVNLNQAVYNGTNTATVGCLQNQVASLLALTKLVVPNTSVCPGWGNVTVTPAAATTTTG